MMRCRVRQSHTVAFSFLILHLCACLTQAELKQPSDLVFKSAQAPSDPSAVPVSGASAQDVSMNEDQKTLTGEEDTTSLADQSPGRAALDDARLRSPNDTTSSNPGSVIVEDEDGYRREMHAQPGADFAHSAGRNVTAAEVAMHSPLPAVRCADGPCVELAASFLSAVEGDLCRSLFINGKCPVACGQAIAAVTGNETWSRCATTCGNDVVGGAAERWAALCGARQETLIDQGKEAVKSVLGDGLSSRLHFRAIVQFFLAVLILVLGVGYGYRRGAVSAHAYRLQKRRLLSRKNSDVHLPI